MRRNGVGSDRSRSRQGLLLVGLTGSIGMGKSSAARALRREGLAIHDADRTVHHLLGPGGAAVARVSAAFPGVERAGVIDRQKLGRQVFGNPEALTRLEAIIHPLVRGAEKRFLDALARRRHSSRPRLAILDIPLLYESGGDRRCDAVILVTAPEWLQRQRVLSRDGMSVDRFEAILSHQVPDKEKRRRTPYLVETGLGHRDTLNKLRGLVRVLENRRRGPLQHMR